MKSFQTYRFGLVTTIIVVLMTCAGTDMSAQGTLSDSLVLRSPLNGRLSLVPHAGHTQALPWTLVFPDTVGISNSMMYVRRVGSVDSLTWLPPGAENTALTITGGVPTWTAGANWLLAGNPAINEATQFLGTTDANDLILRSNNLIRMRVNQEALQGIDISRPTSIDGAYSILNLGMNMTTAGGHAIPQDNTRLLSTSIDFGSGNAGVGQTGALYLDWKRVWAQRAPTTTYDTWVGDYFHWQANNAAAINNIIGYWSERRSGATNNTVTNLYHFRAELPGSGTVSNLYGFHMGTPGGTLNNVYAFNVENIASGTGRFAFRYNASGANRPFGVTAGGQVGLGTLTPAAGMALEISGSSGTANIRSGALSGNSVTSAYANSLTDGLVTADNNGDILKRSAAAVLNPVAWLVTGNSGTSPATNFLGTTDASALVVRTSNVERLRVLSTGEVGIGTPIPLAGSRLTIASVGATGSNGVNVDMTATTASNGILVQNVGATGANNAGIVVSTTSDGTGNGILIGRGTGLNAPDVGILIESQSTGVSTLPLTTSTGTGFISGSDLLRHRIGFDGFVRASNLGDAYGIRANAISTGAGLGIAGLFQTTGVPGNTFSIVASSVNDDDVYLGSTNADIPASLTTLLTGTSNRSLTYLFDARISGAALFVSTGGGDIEVRAPAVLTSHEYRLPSTQGGIGSALRIASLAGTEAQLEWTPEPVAPAPLFARRTSDAAYSSTTLASDAQLTLPLAATYVYEFEGLIAFDGTTVDADLQLAFTIPAGAAIRWGVVNAVGTSIAPSSITGSGVAVTDIPVNTTSPGTDMSIYIKGLVVMGGTAGNLTLQVGTTTTGKTVNILTNSFVKATRMTN